MRSESTELTKIATFARPISVKADSGCSYPVYAVTKHGGMVPSADYFKKQVHSRDVEGYKVVARGQFAYATIHLDEGSIGTLDTADHCIISPMYTVFEVDADRIHPPYLLRLLKSPWALSQYSVMGSGSVHRRRSISFETLARLEVALPELPEQKRIATVLEKAESLRRKRKEAARLADEFLQAAFYDRCGDPVSNSMSWPEKCISEIGDITTGNTPSRDVDAYFGNAIEWIKSDNISTSSHVLTKAREGLSELGATLGRIVPAGSTLMTCIAGSASVIGNVALADRSVAFNQQINAVTPYPGIDADFLYALLLFSKPRVQAASTNSMKGMVSKGTLEKVRVIWPPADVQRYIATLFRKSWQLLGRMERADPSPLFAVLQDKLLA